MKEAAYFLQECPTCGRSLRIRVEFLGRQLICQHCRGALLAREGNSQGSKDRDIMQRAAELLDSPMDVPRPE